MSFMKPAFFCWLGFRGPDCNVIADQGSGPDARPSWAGSGPRPEVARPCSTAAGYGDSVCVLT